MGGPGGDGLPVALPGEVPTGPLIRHDLPPNWNRDKCRCGLSKLLVWTVAVCIICELSSINTESGSMSGRVGELARWLALHV